MNPVSPRSRQPAFAWFPRPARAGLEWLLLGLLVLAALLIRVYNLDSFPDTVLADEADNTQAAIRILYNHPPGNELFGFDWTSQPAFSIYKQAAFLAVFGFNILALRLPSAVISSLALIPFYLLLRRQCSVPASFLATVLLATGVWYLNFSRSGWNNIDICFYMLMAMLFLVMALRTMTAATVRPAWMWLHFGAAGFFCAMGLYGYPSGRAITLGVIAFLPIALWFYRRYWKTVLVGYCLMLVVEAVTFAPEAAYIARNWDLFNGRSKVVFLLNSPEYQADPWGTVSRQINRNIRGPWDGAVNNTAQYSPAGEPQLDRPTGLLVLLGMVLTLAVRRWRGQAETWLWWLMLLAGWGLTQLLTVGTPNGARGVGYMPALVYFAGVGLDGPLRLLAWLAARWGRARGALTAVRSAAAAVLAGAILLAGYGNVTHYVAWQNQPRTRQDRHLYVTTREFPAWAADVVARARTNQGVSNVGGWRDAHPLHDLGDPYGISSKSAP